jgi:predicted DNA-binding protein with PD1-like motif
VKTKLLLEQDGLRTFAVVFKSGDEVKNGLMTFASQHRITGAQFSAIGAFSQVTLAYFEWETKRYREIPIYEQVEALSLLGNFALKNDKPALHAHVVIGKADGTALGGHLVRATVRPTLEVIVSETPHQLQRRFDEETGLALLDLP